MPSAITLSTGEAVALTAHDHREAARLAAEFPGLIEAQIAGYAVDEAEFLAAGDRRNAALSAHLRARYELAAALLAWGRAGRGAR